MSDRLIGKPNAAAEEGVEGIDKSIGDDSLRHSLGGTYDPDRKLYILNIKNTKQKQLDTITSP